MPAQSGTFARTPKLFSNFAKPTLLVGARHCLAHLQSQLPQLFSPALAFLEIRRFEPHGTQNAKTNPLLLRLVKAGSSFRKNRVTNYLASAKLLI